MGRDGHAINKSHKTSLSILITIIMTTNSQKKTKSIFHVKDSFIDGTPSYTLKQDAVTLHVCTRIFI